jgi:tetratricopeptide (TPR) repeat protein
MIQPLKSSKTTWFVYWLDLEEPVPSGDDYFLPTLLIVCDHNGAPLDAPDILEELDQIRVENYLIKLFEKIGTPDRVTLCVSDDWDDEAWKTFSKDNNVDIRFQRFDRGGPEELRTLARTVVLRFAREAGAVPRSRDVARGLVNTALRVRSPRKKLALLRTALDRDADCSTARVELADVEFQHGNWKACLSAYDEVITRELPQWQARHPEWWIARETRPLLRAFYGRGMTLWHQGRHADAAAQFEALLELNARDNQGVRFFIPLLHLLAEDQEAATESFAFYEKKFPEDYAEPALLFGWGLCQSLDGDETGAMEKYRRAILKNIYIAPMLLEEAEPPRGLWHPNDRAEPGYASEFIDSYAVLWDRETGALRHLRDAWQEMQPRVKEIVALRERMADFQDQRYEPDYKKLWQKLVAEDEHQTESIRGET